MVDMKNDIVSVYPLAYLLVTLSWILSIATPTVGRVFLTINIIKNSLLNQIRDKWTNDCDECLKVLILTP
jgi:hypothetical protein